MNMINETIICTAPITGENSPANFYDIFEVKTLKFFKTYKNIYYYLGCLREASRYRTRLNDLLRHLLDE